MAATDGQIVVAAARWADESQSLREFIAKHPLPAVVKITKGQYGGLGVPTLPNPGLQSAALLVSAGRRHKIAAQAIKIKEGRRVVSVGPRLAIPDTYHGFFELLSEEGRAGRCIETVTELARRRLEGGCLVREAIRAIVARVDADGGVTADGARTVASGETLMPSGEVTLGGSKGRYLRCVDSRGDTVLLGLDQRGRFSALAKEDHISGVHTARNLLRKRLPLTVRLVHGSPPRGLKSPAHFVPELRLLATFEEEHVFALPLNKEAGVVIALPLAAPLKLQRTRNTEQLRGLQEFRRLVDKCGRLAADVADHAHVLDGKLGDAKALRLCSSTSAKTPPAKSGFLLRRSASSDSAAYHRMRDENRPPVDDYDEIDQIYDYVRGFAPLPKHIRSPWDAHDSSPHPQPPLSPSSTPGHVALLPDTKPEPPPIETIPTKKYPLPPKGAPKAEKRTRRGASTLVGADPATSTAATAAAAGKTETVPPKLYVKNTQRGRLLRQKSESPLKETPPPGGGGGGVTKAGSPIFNVRYKSLSNLHQGMEMDGTLDSSHSGGRTSGDSGPKLPEKRSRRLSRPRSLTNLVWELRGGNPPPPPPPPAHQPPAERSKKSSSKLTLSGHKRIGTLYL